MSWIALVGPEIEENLSLRYLASALHQAGYRVEIIPFHHEQHFSRVLQAVLTEEPPLLVGLSLAFQWRARDFLALAMGIKEGGYRGHITVGGHFATFAAKELLGDFPELDSVCRQEAELTIVALARALEHGTPLTEVAGLALPGPEGAVLTAAPALPDLATLPWPDRRGNPATCFAHGIAPLVASRGCYANCSFCCIAAWHEQSLPGKRYRIRTVEAVADEMVALQATRGIDIFVFHDDNFFVPGHRHNRERFEALADALKARNIGPFATVVKARPTDVDPAVFQVLKERLHCIRAYIGVETDADQGLKTLQRWAHSRQNHSAIELVRRLDLYTCFNLLLFDPDTTLESVETNIAFMRSAADFPFNFGRVELYAGTPLLARMQAEGRCEGDYLQWDYRLGNPEVEELFQLSMDCFAPRNFGNDALANRIMGTRFDIEVVRHFHPEIFRKSWLREGQRLNRALAEDTAAGLEQLVGMVRASIRGNQRAEALGALQSRLRATEKSIAAACRALAAEMLEAVGQGLPLTELGDQVATPLQQPGRMPALEQAHVLP